MAASNKPREPDFRGRCPRCLVLPDHCVCAEIAPVQTAVDLVVLRHVKEAWKSTNTARWAMLALPDARLYSYGGPGDPRDFPDLVQPGTFVLFPGSTPEQAPVIAPRRVIIPDGTWAQSRRMVQRIPCLQRLPKLTLPPSSRQVVRLRQPPRPDGMSTIEAIAQVLRRYDSDAKARILEEVHDRMVIQVLKAQGGLEKRLEMLRGSPD